PYGLVERRVFADGHGVGGHDLADLARVGAGVFSGKTAGTDEEFEPARAPALGAGFGAAQEIPLGDDAGELAARIDHGKTADPRPEHDVDCVGNGFPRPYGEHLLGHDVADFHRPASKIRRRTWRTRAGDALMKIKPRW